MYIHRQSWPIEARRGAAYSIIDHAVAQATRRDEEREEEAKRTMVSSSTPAPATASTCVIPSSPPPFYMSASLYMKWILEGRVHNITVLPFGGLLLFTLRLLPSPSSLSTAAKGTATATATATVATVTHLAHVLWSPLVAPQMDGTTDDDPRSEHALIANGTIIWVSIAPWQADMTGGQHVIDILPSSQIWLQAGHGEDATDHVAHHSLRHAPFVFPSDPTANWRSYNAARSFQHTSISVIEEGGDGCGDFGEQSYVRLWGIDSQARPMHA
jgi:hypothetical protein